MEKPEEVDISETVKELLRLNKERLACLKTNAECPHSPKHEWSPLDVPEKG